jgi:hypothetical protein
MELTRKAETKDHRNISEGAISMSMPITPERVLLATLHKVGDDVRLADDFQLARLFNQASGEHELFQPFAWHRHYHVSDVLSQALQALDQAGSIVRENAAQTYFRASRHTLGQYGESIYNSLTPQQRLQIETVANAIKHAFEASHGPGTTG